MRAGLLGNGAEGGEEGGVLDQGGVADDRAVRQGGDRGLQMQHPADRYGDDTGPQRFEGGAELAYPLGVGAAAAADVHGVADLEDVAAVERAGRADLVERAAQRLGGAAGGGYLGPAHLRARPGDQRHIAEDDHGVLDEHRVRAVVGGRDLGGVPTVVPERTDIAFPLVQGERGVHRAAFDMGDQTLGYPGAGAADEGLGAGHESLSFGSGGEERTGGERKGEAGEGVGAGQASVS